MNKIDSSLISDSVKSDLDKLPIEKKRTRKKVQDIELIHVEPTNQKSFAIPVSDNQAVLSLFVGTAAASIKTNNPSISTSKLVADSLHIGEELYYGYINLLNEINRYPSGQ